MSKITTYCHLNSTSCLVNGKLLASFNQESEDNWLKQLYKINDKAYPKFHKMDQLSQVGYLLSEFLIKAHPDELKSYADDEIALVFANSTSSADTDIRFTRSYKEQHAPSPALFVYTLPNIVLGEISIANKWFGENMFAILPKFAPDFYVNYCQILMASGSKAVMAGWIEVNENEIDAFAFVVENKELGLLLESNNLQGLKREGIV